MQVVILCGGKGTRFGETCKFLPKPMLTLCGKPLLDYAVTTLSQQGFKDILFLTGHQGSAISEYFNSGKYHNITPKYVRETSPLGTAGCLKAAEDQLEDTFLLIHGDHVFDIDLKCLLAFHKTCKSAITFVTHSNSHPHDSDLVEVDKFNRILTIHKKPQPKFLPCKNLVLDGIMVVEKKVLSLLPEGPSDLTKDLYCRALSKFACFSYQTSDYILDVGTPERMDRVEADIQRDEIKRKKKVAVFLDRDGTINNAPNFVNAPDEVEIFQETCAALRLLRNAGYLLVVVTNQGGISLGYLTEKTLDKIHARLDSLLATKGCFIDRYYHCPHYESDGNYICGCRKPGTLMMEQAAVDMNIDMSKSWVVGDRTCDILMANNAELKSVLVETGSAGKDGEFPHAKPTYTAVNLYEAAKKIVSKV